VNKAVERLPKNTKIVSGVNNFLTFILMTSGLIAVRIEKL
jgi:hypothetical protein